jgi:hypothetical protein
MTPLQKMALRQAAEELQTAYMTILTSAQKPDFGNPCSRESKAGEAVQRIKNAQDWIDAALKA